MKVLILAGGYGSRLSEETDIRPKPLVEIGNYPIIWHIMKLYSHYGFDDFIILLGYKGYMIKEYFVNYMIYNNDIEVKIKENSVKLINSSNESWNITLIDTGVETMTAGRIKRAEKYIGNQRFLLTYGDGLSDVDIGKLIVFHDNRKCTATVTAAQPEGRFGTLSIDQRNKVSEFMEKPKGDNNWINAGFFVFEPEILEYISGDESVLEKDVLPKLALEDKLSAYKHDGFWHPMDTLRDKKRLNKMWFDQRAKWCVW